MNEKNAHRRIRMGCAWLALPLALGLATPVAIAEDQSGADCAMIESREERLACFDAAYGKGGGPTAAAEAEVSGPSNMDAPAAAVVPATAAAAQAATPREADFGLEKSKDETEGESLTSGIAVAGKDGYGKLWFELENGQLWRQTEYKRFPVKAGQVAEIRHGSLGSYKLYIKGEKRWTRVRRAE